MVTAQERIGPGAVTVRCNSAETAKQHFCGECLQRCFHGKRHLLAQVETADELDGEYYETFAFPRARGNRLYKNFVWFNQAFREQYARA